MKREEIEKEGWLFAGKDRLLASEDLSRYSVNIPAMKGPYLLQFDNKNNRIRIKKKTEIVFLGVCETIEDFKNICNKNKIY
jgi:hypothetical protein